MTAKELAKAISCSEQWVFALRRRFPDQCPKSFDDVEGWKAALAHSRTQSRTKNNRGAKILLQDSSSELSDIVRLTRARANKVEVEHEILTIELAATKRQVVRQEEVMTIFAKLANVLRARLMKMRTDLPSSLLGLDSAGMDKVLGERMEEALAHFELPKDFFEPRGIV